MNAFLKILGSIFVTPFSFVLGVLLGVVAVVVLPFYMIYMVIESIWTPDKEDSYESC